MIRINLDLRKYSIGRWWLVAIILTHIFLSASINAMLMADTVTMLIVNLVTFLILYTITFLLKYWCRK